MKTIMIMAGGTGGHVFPALAVADVLTQRGVTVTWMGTAKGIEARLVPEAGYVLNLISVQGLRGNGLMGWLTAPFKLIKVLVLAIPSLSNACISRNIMARPIRQYKDEPPSMQLHSVISQAPRTHDSCFRTMNIM